jgi:antibiotic biosynthesis monooxygenase (ABM) superfamily enzyme
MLQTKKHGSSMPRTYKPGRVAFCMMVFAAIYPLVTGLAYLMQMVVSEWPIWQRHLFVVPIVVLAMVFVIIPRIQALFAHLAGQGDSTRS